jgi:hypothetical protein
MTLTAAAQRALAAALALAAKAAQALTHRRHKLRAARR